MSTDLRPVIASLVPRAWKPEQALQAVRLLQHAIEAERVNEIETAGG